MSRHHIVREFVDTTEEAHYLLGGVAAGFLVGFAAALYLLERLVLSADLEARTTPDRTPEGDRSTTTDDLLDPDDLPDAEGRS
jgi:hypothetical protein